jgi:hypothetical protein
MPDQEILVTALNSVIAILKFHHEPGRMVVADKGRREQCGIARAQFAEAPEKITAFCPKICRANATYFGSD